MIVIYSKNKVPIRITEERWEHIARRHPEMRDEKERVLETISDPDLIQRGDFGELLAGRFYANTALTAKYLIVAYREASTSDGFVLTAYFTKTPSKRRMVIWKR